MTGANERLAVIPVRAGVLPAGALETVAEACGRAVLAGDGTSSAAGALAGVAAEPVRTWEAGAFAPGAWAEALAPALSGVRIVLLPASPDGRDLAPRLAAALARPLISNAMQVDPSRALCIRWGGRALQEIALDEPSVVTLQPGVRGVEVEPGATAPEVEELVTSPAEAGRDARVIEVLPPDAATIDLAEAPRIFCGGAGLGGAEEFALLAEVAERLGASVGATRVVTDSGVVGHDRQIGTTGVAVNPRLHVALGVSGAVQHTAGLGAPDHIISVNLDPHCPMMAMADLALVCDAPGLLRELSKRLGIDGGSDDRS